MPEMNPSAASATMPGRALTRRPQRKVRHHIEAARAPKSSHRSLEKRQHRFQWNTNNLDGRHHDADQQQARRFLAKAPITVEDRHYQTFFRRKGQVDMASLHVGVTARFCSYEHGESRTRSGEEATLATPRSNYRPSFVQNRHLFFSAAARLSSPGSAPITR